jgi:uncharacterized protein (DUF362 family)
MESNINEILVSVVKSEGHYKGAAMALELIKDQIERSLKDKKRVMVKPNFVSTSRQLAATHVDAVKAVLDTVSKYYNGKIIIGEGPALGNLENAIKNFEYAKLIDEYDVEFLDLNEDNHVLLEGVDSNLNSINLKVSKTLVETDYLISVAMPKTHDCVIATLSIKNVVVGSLVSKKEKERIHQGTKAININIAKLAQHCLPNLALIDGYIGMQGSGPVSGDPLELGVSSASMFPVSLDAVMAKIMGFDPNNIGYLHYLSEWGIGVADLDKIIIVGETIENVRKEFTPHPTYLDQLKWR